MRHCSISNAAGFVQTLLPENAVLKSVPIDLEKPQPLADAEPMRFRLEVEDTTRPKDMRFLHVLQGADAGETMDVSTTFQNDSGKAYQGVLVRNTALLFPQKLGTAFSTFSYTVPDTTTAHLISGLKPGAKYAVALKPENLDMKVTVSAGATYTADKAGVIIVTTPQALVGITPKVAQATATGGAQTATISAFGPTEWVATSNAPWITVKTPEGQGDGPIRYQVAANKTHAARSGTVSVNQETLTVQQAGLQCTFTLSPSTVSIAHGQSSANVTVNTQDGCEWATKSSVPWITVSAGAEGDGQGTVMIQIAENTATASRTGTVTIAGKSVNITQAGVPGNGEACTYKLSLVRKLMSAAASTKGVAVNTAAACVDWTVSSDAEWLTFKVVPATSKAPATVLFTVAQNVSTEARDAILTVAGQPIAITQAGNVGSGCIYALGSELVLTIPTTRTIGNAGGKALVSVTSPGGCSWTAESDVDWIALVKTSYIGNATVYFTVAANNTGTQRIGHITLAGYTYTVQQDK